MSQEKFKAGESQEVFHKKAPEGGERMKTDSPRQKELPPERKKIVESGFSEGRNLYGDMFNVWVLLGFTPPEEIETITPLSYYRQYMEERKRSYSQGEINYVMELSDPGAIADFDRLVDEFNSDLERIKRDKDVATIKKFQQKASELIYKKR